MRECVVRLLCHRRLVWASKEQGPEDSVVGGGGGRGGQEKPNKINHETPGFQDMAYGFSISPLHLEGTNCLGGTLFGSPVLHYFDFNVSFKSFLRTSNSDSLFLFNLLVVPLDSSMTRNQGFLVCILLTLFSVPKSFTIFIQSFLFSSHVSSLFKESTNLSPMHLMSFPAACCPAGLHAPLFDREQSILQRPSLTINKYHFFLAFKEQRNNSSSNNKINERKQMLDQDLIL